MQPDLMRVPARARVLAQADIFPALVWAHVAKMMARRVMAERVAAEVVMMMTAERAAAEVVMMMTAERVAAEMVAVERLLAEMMMVRGVAAGEVEWRDEQ